VGDEIQDRAARERPGYSISVPRLPGCWSQGSTAAAATQNLQDGIQEHLAARDDLLEAAVVREVEVAS